MSEKLEKLMSSYLELILQKSFKDSSKKRKIRKEIARLKTRGEV